MMFKPDLVTACHQYASLAAPYATVEAAKLVTSATAYGKTRELGGPACASVAKALGGLGIALELQGVQAADVGGTWDSSWGNTYTLTSQAWEALTF